MSIKSGIYKRIRNSTFIEYEFLGSVFKIVTTKREEVNAIYYDSFYQKDGEYFNQPKGNYSREQWESLPRITAQMAIKAICFNKEIFG